MELKEYSKPADFLAAAGDTLRTDEARYGLIYGLARATAERPHLYGIEDPWFFSLADAGDFSAMGWRTPPFVLGLAWVGGDPEAAMGPIVQAVRSHWSAIPGVIGQREIADPFCQRWCAECGVTVASSMGQIIYRLDKIKDVPPVSGRLRLATLADKELIQKWSMGFNIDCFGDEGKNRPLLQVDLAVEMARLFIWEDDGTPVCMVGRTRPTEQGMSIGPVYTPPEHRRKGYATACTAAVCREVFKSGYKLCTLYADRSNPASNTAYVNVGFYPVCESVEYTFSVPVL